MIRLAVALVLALSALVAGQPPCLAGACPSMQCFGPCGGPECLCIRRTISEPGWCYSAQAAPHLLARGWRIVR
jgi:hypothetical protein